MIRLDLSEDLDNGKSSTKPSNTTTGWVYILSNPSLPNLIKIGFTTNTPASRAKELSGASGVPEPFVVEFARHCLDPRSVEYKMHCHFSDERHGKEFFMCSPQEARDTLRELTFAQPMEVGKIVTPYTSKEYVKYLAIKDAADRLATKANVEYVAKREREDLEFELAHKEKMTLEYKDERLVELEELKEFHNKLFSWGLGAALLCVFFVYGSFR